jgi:hypothetical protein
MDVDAPNEHCTSDQECAPLVCDLTGPKSCVQCTSVSAAACVGTTPVCGMDEACRACVAHAECASNACLPDGSCGTDATVAYVDPTGPGPDCTRLAPCKKVSDALKTGRPFVKFTGSTDEPVTVNAGRVVTFLADPGATLTRASGGAILTVQDDETSLSVYDLSISNAPNTTSGIGCVIPAGAGSPSLSLTRATLSNNPGGAISVSGGTLKVSQSKITNNTPGGGISVMSGVFVIVGNLFYGNGATGSFVGGISLGATVNAADRLDFNTFALNTARDGFGSGIHCLVDTFTARDNIVSDNLNPTATAQVSGTCLHTHSLVHPGLPPAGTTNLGEDPKFVNEGAGDLHLQATSPARGKADPAADLSGIASRDIDGAARLAPADLGAYEYNATQPSAAAVPDAEGARP